MTELVHVSDWLRLAERNGLLWLSAVIDERTHAVAQIGSPLECEAYIKDHPNDKLKQFSADDVWSGRVHLEGQP